MALTAFFAAWMCVCALPPDSGKARIDSLFTKNYPLTSVEVQFEGALHGAAPGDNLSRINGPANGIFIKNYGPGLATLSLQGSSAAQTKVLWEGMSLNSGSLGTVDASLIPFYLLNSGTILCGQESLTLTAGGLGGALIFQAGAMSRPRVPLRSANAFMSFSTLNGFSVGAAAREEDSTRSSELRVIVSRYKNDYLFRNTALRGQPVQRLRNAASQLIGATYTGTRYVGNWKYTLATWLQHSFRQLPPLMTALYGGEDQKDEHLRTVCSAENTASPLGNLKISAGYAYESMRYRDSMSGLNALTLIHKYFGSGVYSLHLGPHTLLARLTAGRDHAQNDNLVAGAARSYLDPAILYTYAGAMQYELVFSPRFVRPGGLLPAGSAAAVYNSGSRTGLRLKLSAAYNGNYPTLNDLYWNPGGNPALRPEQGPALSLDTRLKPMDAPISVEASIFAKQVDNYIQWQPGSAGYWTAQNLARVLSRGAEWRLIYSPQGGQVGKRLSFSLLYVRTTDTRFPEAQLLYVPPLSMNIEGALRYRDFYLSAQLNYVDKRFTGSEYLPSYAIADLALHWKPTSQFAGFFRMNNIAGSSYQVVAYRPMPGRWAEIGFSIYSK